MKKTKVLSRGKLDLKRNKLLRKNNIDVSTLKKNHKEFLKDIKLMLELQQRFRNKKIICSLKKLIKLQ